MAILKDMPEKYLLRLMEKDDGDTLDSFVEGTVPRLGEDIRIMKDSGVGRYYKVTRVLHTLCERNVSIESEDKTTKAELAQVYAKRYQ